MLVGLLSLFVVDRFVVDGERFINSSEAKVKNLNIIHGQPINKNMLTFGQQ